MASTANVPAEVERPPEGEWPRGPFLRRSVVVCSFDYDLSDRSPTLRDYHSILAVAKAYHQVLASTGDLPPDFPPVH